ncbi:replication fork protection component Swi3-domain-containing protein [Aspergillus karnatakaensis]|uniref:Chromosome segregation in meiosis protein 3 n=1 Tax=Aspergillus karnatakaensis TaxID=1810916 RepID=UPI003CCE0CD3
MANDITRSTKGAQTTEFVDDLFDYDIGLDGIVQEINTNATSAVEPQQSAPPNNSGVVLGLDEEVRVAKKRQPVAKLDENRLLTQAGIPKLRRSAKKNLKFKGKGHEFSDLARLLNFYQLWLDDLFPRARFVDGLAMIEKLGRSKRLQTTRRQWIEEEKPEFKEAETSDLPPDSNGTRNGVGNLVPFDNIDDDLFIPNNNPPQPANDEDHASHDDDDYDELDILLREHSEPHYGKVSESATGGVVDRTEDDDLDQLGSLLREHVDEAKVGGARLDQSKADILEPNSHADEYETLEGSEMFEKR